MRMELATAFAVNAFVVAAITGGGLAIYSGLTAAYLRASLPPAARLAAEAIEAKRLPSPQGLVELQKYAETYTFTDSWLEPTVWLVMAGVAMLAGVAAGMAMAWRIARPVSAVATAAREVASGRLDARAETSHRGAGETAALIADFNQMAEELQRADEEIRATAAAIAHELRTPLTVLRGRLQGVGDGVFEIEPKMIRGLILQVDGLARIVDDLRTLSLASNGRLVLQLGHHDLAREAEAVAQTIAMDLAAAGLDLQLDLRPAPVISDDARLRQAILAILDNTRRHAREGGEVLLSTGRAQDFAWITIADRGPGLPPGREARAFERFWRSDESRSRDSGGSGLGLAVVDAIVRAHGGSVSARPRVGGGAVFEIRLPVELNETSHLNRAQARSSLRQASTVSR
jgi:two-component system sensor histidine kinase AdeS